VLFNNPALINPSSLCTSTRPISRAGGQIRLTIVVRIGKCKLESLKFKSKISLSPGVAGSVIRGYGGWRARRGGNQTIIKNI